MTPAQLRGLLDAGLLPPGSILPSAPLVPPHDGLLRAAKAVLAVDVLMRNAQNGMPAHVFNGVLEVLQEEAIPDLRSEVARIEGGALSSALRSAKRWASHEP